MPVGGIRGLENAASESVRRDGGGRFCLSPRRRPSPSNCVRAPGVSTDGSDWRARCRTVATRRVASRRRAARPRQSRRRPTRKRRRDRARRAQGVALGSRGTTAPARCGVGVEADLRGDAPRVGGADWPARPTGRGLCAHQGQALELAKSRGSPTRLVVWSDGGQGVDASVSAGRLRDVKVGGTNGGVSISMATTSPARVSSACRALRRTWYPAPVGVSTTA